MEDGPGSRGIPGHVHVHGEQAIHPAHHLGAFGESPPAMASFPTATTPLGSGMAS